MSWSWQRTDVPGEWCAEHGVWRLVVVQGLSVHWRVDLCGLSGERCLNVASGIISRSGNSGADRAIDRRQGMEAAEGGVRQWVAALTDLPIINHEHERSAS